MKTNAKNNQQDTDILIGRKLREVRNMKNMSQSALADEAGLTFQQIQKYEKGVNRISVSRLVNFCQILGVPYDVFISPLLKPDHEYKPLDLSRKDSTFLQMYCGLPHGQQKTVRELVASLSS